MKYPTARKADRWEGDADAPRMHEKVRRTERGRPVVLVLLALLGGLAACHKGMSIGKKGTGGAGSGTAGGAADGAAGGIAGGAAGRAADGAAGGAAGGIAGGAAGSAGSPGAGGWAIGGVMGSGGIRDGAAGTGGTSGSGGVRSHVTASGGADAGAVASGGAPNVWDGGAAGAADAMPIPEPVDDRPPRPAWELPFTTPLGTPGWQQSTQPICDANQGFYGAGAFDVWADDRGVFALVGEGCDPKLGSPCGKDGATIKLNSGTGWQLLYQFAPGSPQSPRLWPSVPKGPLLVSGPLGGYGTGAAFIDNGRVFAFQPTLNGYGAYGGFAVGSDLAYVIDLSRLLKYSGGAWSTVGDLTGALDLQAVWADPERAIVAGYNQTVGTQEGTGPLELMSGVPIGRYQAVWAFGPNDVWFGNNANQLLHYDGQKWKAHATGAKSTEGIKSLWGTSGVVYFTTRTEFGRWDGSQIEILLQAQDDGADLFGTLWGRSTNEVFVAVRDWRYRDTACGATFLLWFDGSQFHQF